MNNRNLQKHIELKQKKVDAGLMSEKFPKVKSVTIEMTYYHKTFFMDEEIMLMVRTVHYAPGSAAFFEMRCPESECEAVYDLRPEISRLVRNKKNRASGKAVCKGRCAELPKDHASIDYSISIRYA